MISCTTVRRLGPLALLIGLTVQPTSRLAAQQVFPNRATAYLHPSDVNDARALWVNPAGLGIQREASIYAEFSVNNPGSRGKLGQIDAGFNARGLSLGYQRDMLDNGLHPTTLRLGLAGGSGGLAGGVSIAQYRGGSRSTGWDAGLLYTGVRTLSVAVVAANLGQPVVAGLRQQFQFIPAATWHPAPLPELGLSAHARITSDSVAAYAFGVSVRTRRWPLQFVARMDTDGDLRRGAFAFGLTVGGQDRVGAIISTPGDVSHIDTASLYGLSTREPAARRR